MKMYKCIKMYKRKFLWLALITTMAVTVITSSFWGTQSHVTMVKDAVDPGIRYIPKSADDTSCKGLLNGGRLADGNWQPDGCSLHNYTSGEFKQCLINRYHSNQNKSNTLVFVGDGVMLQRFSALVDLLLDRPITYPKDSINNIFADSTSHTEIHFRWKPMASEVLNFVKKWNTADGLIERDFLMLGVNYWELVDAERRNISAVSDSSLHGYQMKVGEISKALETHKADVDIVWAQPGPVNFTSISRNYRPKARHNSFTGPHNTNEGLQWLAAQDHYRKSFPYNNDTVVEMYNALALKELERRSIRTMEFYPLGKLFLKSTNRNDGIHPSEMPMSAIQQVLANYLCNSVIHFNEGTCCRNKD